MRSENMASSPLPDQQAARPPGISLASISYRGWVTISWLLCCAIMLWLSRHDLASFTFGDPDDAMRLQQVRHWLGGQGFHDVSQHGVNPPLGGPMHWSRIVDAPI